jgi:hypothetical protein
MRLPQPNGRLYEVAITAYGVITTPFIVMITPTIAKSTLNGFWVCHYYFRQI